MPDSNAGHDHEPAAEQRKTAAALTTLVERLAARHLDETIEPEHYSALLRAAADGE